MRIGIVGAGVAGSLVAKSLAGAPGFEVDIFDRAAPGAQDGAGTGLNLGPNGLKALRLHDPETHARLREASYEWRRWIVDLTDGTRLLDIDLLDLAEETGARLRWSELYALLRAPLTAKIRWAHEFEALEYNAAGKLVPVFRTANDLARFGGYDLLIAGDGRFSRLREIVCGPIRATHLGIAIWRLLTDETGCPFDDYGQWFHASNRLLAYRVPGGHVYACGVFPIDTPDIEPRHKTQAFQRALFGAKLCPAAAWILDRAFAAPELHWARLQISPLARGNPDDKVLLLGDAAQAMVPTLGQGATQAIEDGVLAAALLRQGKGIAEIAALRDSRVEFVRDFSIEASDTLLPGADPVAGTLAKNAPEFRAKLRRLYTDVPGPDVI
jgi:2-polyprenyl-6-methoxyphenol hydroxylase-like FAD-dependent oxidoreductase